MRQLILSSLVLVAIGSASAIAPPKRVIDLHCNRLAGLGLPLAEGDTAVYRVALTGQVGQDGAGTGSLVLDLTGPPAYDAFGFVAEVAKTREVRLECAFKLVKKTTKAFTVRIGGPGSDQYEEHREEWSLYSITGPKITSRLFLALPPEGPWARGRFLVQDQDGKVKHAIDLVLPPQPEPCHPGCFPAGTVVRVPGGTSQIERIRPGDKVATISKEGQEGAAPVEQVFVTRNKLLEIRTTSGDLITTETQPLALEVGGFRAAGELKAGDRIWRWMGTKRQAANVLGVKAAGRDAQVFNLVLGAPTTFVADDFLVRSKPPADVVAP